MFLGNPMMMRKRAPLSYADILAAMTGKAIVLRGDQSSGTNGVDLNTAPWDNEVSATDTTGLVTWATSAQNGFRGIYTATGSREGNTGIALSTLLPSTTRGCTLFAVERRTGTQGASAGSNRYLNSNVIADSSGYFGIHFEPNSREFNFYTFGNVANFCVSGYSFTDSVTYVVAVRLSDTNGAVRFNFNGSATNFPSAAMQTPSSKSSNIRVLRPAVSAAAYGFEYIACSQELDDATMDAFVTGLKTKWGIT